MNDAFCGGPDGTSLSSTTTLIPDAVAKNVATIILMGDPRHVATDRHSMSGMQLQVA